MKSLSLPATLATLVLMLVGPGCSSSEGLGNLLAGQSCDAFTLHGDPKCVCCSESGGACIPGESPCAPEEASPSCGNRCPEGLSCVKKNGRDVCGYESECVGPDERSCGNCGTQTRTCEDGQWSSWSSCSDEGECAAGSSQACTDGFRTCTSACSWGECQECACTPGETQECDDGNGQQQCDGNCSWGACVAYACQPGESQQQACGLCGEQTITCLDNHTWSAAGACQGQGECQPGAFEACGGGQYRECDESCGWSACVTVECEPGTLETEACGSCGARTRQCEKGTWSAFSACQNEGVCEPNDSRACGNQGTQSCNAQCQWNACTGQACDGSPVELCGNCGFRSRTCSNGTWSAFGACTGERDCLPGESQSCGGGMTQSCGLDCYWGACQ